MLRAIAKKKDLTKTTLQHIKSVLSTIFTFIVAEKIDIDHVDHQCVLGQAHEEPAAWQNAMAAFQSPKIDNYLGRLKELDRRVLLRYHVNDPFQILGNYRWYGLPSYGAGAVIVRGRSLRLGSLRPSRLALAVGFGAAVGSLISSAMLYISYRPYSEILQRFIRKGDEAGLSELSNFLAATQVPLGAQGFIDVREFVFYFWFVVTLLCILALMFVLVRHFKNRLRANAAI